MGKTMTGGFQWGAKRYGVEVEDQEAYLCHCRMCQRAACGVAIAFKNVPKASVVWGVESWHAAWLDTTRLPTARTTDNEPIVTLWKDSLGHVP